MPIADDIAKFYPPDWTSIRAEVLRRAEEEICSRTGKRAADMHEEDLCAFGSVRVPCCEWCGKPHGWTVLVAPSGCWTIDHYAYPHWKRGPLPEPEYKGGGWRPTKVVLTIAHLDQDPRGDDPERLMALCQRCHLTYDARPEQRARRERIYAELRGQQTLFWDGYGGR